MVLRYDQWSGLDSVPLRVPLPARPKQLLTFSFGDRARVHRSGSGPGGTMPRAMVVGPQTYRREDLSVCGRIDSFTIHFQPSGFNRIFGIPMTELTDAAYDARAVIGRDILTLEDQLADTQLFEERIRIVERCLILVARRQRSR